jgi:hypothetical protein
VWSEEGWGIQTICGKERGMNRKLACLTFITMMALTPPLFSQPPGYQPGPSAVSVKTARIALAWGDLFQPASIGIKAVSNLQLAARTNGLPIGGFDKIWISSGDLSSHLVVFMIADSQVQLTDAEKGKLRNYMKSGGFLVLDDAVPDKENSPSSAALLQIANDLAGSNGLVNIPNDHLIYTIMYDLGGPPLINLGNMQRARNDKPQWLRGVMVDGRLALLLSDRGYSTAWSANPGDSTSNDFGLNLISYALVSRER